MTHRSLERLSLGLAVVALSVLSSKLEAGDWTQWGGSRADGHADPMRVPLRLGESNNVTWKTTIPGRGWSSPVIFGDQIWMTSAFETPVKPEDRERRLKASTADQPLTLVQRLDLHAIAVDRQTGKVLHQVPLITQEEPQGVHQLNSYASPTPVIERDRLYCHFGAFGTACVDTKKGRVLWTNTTLRIQHENGPGSSPVVWKNLVMFHMDGSDQQYIVALDKHTGKVAWKTDRSGKMPDHPQLKKAYGTPLVMQIGGREQLISEASDWVYSYDPATGKELWKLSLGVSGFSQSARMVAGHNRIFMSTGFMRPEMIAVDYARSANPEIAWRYSKGAPTMVSPILVEDELYFLSDSGGMLTCVDAHSGKEHYRERLGGNHSASPIFADGRLYIPNREGITTVVKPGRTYEALATNSLPGKIMATPAMVDGAIFIRTDTALYRIEE
jgi:outer membrane protein assembly factor BamB